jgi:hypothetical protein
MIQVAPVFCLKKLVLKKSSYQTFLEISMG